MAKYRELTAREREMALVLARKAKAFMDLHGQSQRKMASGMGWTPGTLNQYLLGNQAINYDALFTICAYLQISPLDVDPTLASRLGHPELQRL